MYFFAATRAFANHFLATEEAELHISHSPSLIDRATWLPTIRTYLIARKLIGKCLTHDSGT